MKNLAGFLFTGLAIVLFVIDAECKSVFISKDSIASYPNFLDDNWVYTNADDPGMAAVTYDDSKWAPVNISLPQNISPHIPFYGVGWFRYHFIADTSITGRPLAMGIGHYGASEIYLDGRLIKSYGVINGPDSTVNIDPQELPFVFQITDAGVHVIAVRYANYGAEKNFKIYRAAFAGFKMTMGEADSQIYHKDLKSTVFTFILMLLSGIFLALSMLHLFMFLYFRTAKSNLYFSIFMFSLALGFLISFVCYASHNPALEMKCLYFVTPVFCSTCLSLSAFINALFSKKKGIRFVIIVALTVITLLLRFLGIQAYIIGSASLLIAVSLEAVITIIFALIRRVKGARIIGTGILFLTLFILTLITMGITTGDVMLNDSTQGGKILLVFMVLAVLSIPVSMSAYQAWSFSSVNKNLALQVEQVRQLSDKTIEQEKEKKRMLENRKEELEREVEQRTSELKESQQQLIQQEKLASLGALTAGIAHEIKNPLNFVNNFSDITHEMIEELIAANNPGERITIGNDIKKNLQKISHHGKRADSIVQSMLQHSRSGKGEKQKTNINKLCEEFLELAYHGMIANHAGFKCGIIKNLAVDLPDAEVVAQDISRVILNLLNNAFYAVKDKNSQEGFVAQVSLTTKPEGNAIKILIRDNGNGIPEALKQKIFEPFFTTKPTGEGTGLGLSICYDIIKTHGGEITVESVENEFTEFAIILPL